MAATPGTTTDRDRLPGRAGLNPSRTGWTTADAIANELPSFRGARPEFGTLMIGVNDWVQGVEPDVFQCPFHTVAG